MNKKYRMPNNETTEDVDLYLASWYKLSFPLESDKYSLFAFNPHLSYTNRQEILIPFALELFKKITREDYLLPTPFEKWLFNFYGNERKEIILFLVQTYEWGHIDITKVNPKPHYIEKLLDFKMIWYQNKTPNELMISGDGINFVDKYCLSEYSSGNIYKEK